MAFFILSNNPLCLEANKQYKLESLINGPVSWSWTDGRTSVEVEGAQFTFSDPTDTGNGTNVAGDQFPAFIFIITVSVSTYSWYQYPDSVSF